MKNCRNCKWAEWNRDAGGRRQFSTIARCVVPFELPPLPLSLQRYPHNIALPDKRYIRVAEDRNIEINCPTWEKLP